IKFTSHGLVEVRVKHSDQQMQFLVKDTGRGISPEQIENLFQPFSQADPSITRKFGGTGLGLVLSRRLANILGGEVALIESRFGQGSTFLVTVHAKSPAVTASAGFIRPD